VSPAGVPARRFVASSASFTRLLRFSHACPGFAEIAGEIGTCVTSRLHHLLDDDDTLQYRP
jgi:hypothetical protein